MHEACRGKTIWRWSSVSATNTSRGRKACLHQNEHPNAFPASWRCPGQPRMPLEALSSQHARFAFGKGCDCLSYEGTIMQQRRPSFKSNLTSNYSTHPSICPHVNHVTHFSPYD